MRVASIASSSDIGSRIVGMRFASMVFPAPGGPINKMLCPPAQATCSARLAACCPCTSRKSTEYCAASESICCACTFTGVKDSGEFIRSRLAATISMPRRPRLPPLQLLSHSLPEQRATSIRTPGPPAPPKAHRAHAAVQRQLAQKHHLVQLFAEELSLAAYQSQRHGQIESRAFLAYNRRSQINRHPLPVRKFKSAVSQRAFDPFAALFDRVIRQSHDVEVLHACGALRPPRLQRGRRQNSVHRSALRLEEHGVDLAPSRSGAAEER